MKTPTCPKCNVPMRLIEPKSTQNFKPFFGCPNFRKGCKQTARYTGSDGYRKATKRSHGRYSKKSTGGSRPTNVDRKPGSEQDVIWKATTEAIKATGRIIAIIVKALAGTGKSFTCLYSMWLALDVNAELKILYLAFNNSIVREFHGSAPSQAIVKTFNGFGWGICNSQLEQKPVLDKKKTAYLIDRFWTAKTEKELKFEPQLKNCVKNLVSLAKHHLSNGNPEEMAELAAKYEISVSSDFEQLAYSLVPKVLQASKEETTICDFDDQCWLPIVLNLDFPQFDLVYVDEAQDFDPLLHLFAYRCVEKSKGKLVIVGDQNQAIYGFRGSSTESIDEFVSLVESKGAEIQEYGLTRSRRCPRIVEPNVQHIVSDFKVVENAIEGYEVETTIDRAVANDEIQPGDMIVCRCNAPLLQLAYPLIKKGNKVVIRGHDIGMQLITLIDRLAGKQGIEDKDINGLLRAVEKWQQNELEKIKGTRNEDSLAVGIRDKADCILSLVEYMESISELKANITNIFSDFDQNGKPKQAIILSSIHRAKGLEAYRVWILWPEITIKCSQEWQQKQESHLEYVAATRVKGDPKIADSGMLGRIRQDKPPA